MPHAAARPAGCDSERYFALAGSGALAEGERTELLDGVIVAMAPQSPLHAACVYRVERVLRSVFPADAVIRVQMPLVAGPASVPEPDLAVLAGREEDFVDRHPSTALLVVEVALATASQDRLTKAPIYAGAGVANYWIVHPAEEWIDVHRGPDPRSRTWRSVERATQAGALSVDGCPGVAIPSERLFPRRAR